MKIALIILGSLILIVGLLGFAGSFALYYNASFPCDAADDSAKRIEQLKKSTDPDDKKLLEVELIVADVAQRECNERWTYVTIALVVASAITFFGLLLLVIGFIIKRKKPAPVS